uniref:Uncharacterized protein n=1 Tax=Gallus gallus TaxID=9031 RepID=A0A8V1AHJ1_CHICK
MERAEGRPGVEAQDGEVLVVLAGLQEVLRSGAFVDEVGVEDVEFVTLHDFGRGVIEVVVGLVVFVPLEARVHAVEEARFAGPVFVGPEVRLARQRHLHAELRLVCSHALLGLAEEDVVGALGGVACGEESPVRLSDAAGSGKDLTHLSMGLSCVPLTAQHTSRPLTACSGPASCSPGGQHSLQPCTPEHTRLPEPSWVLLPVTWSCWRSSSSRCVSSSASSTWASKGSSLVPSSRGLYFPAS